MASEGRNLVGVDIGSTSIKVCEIKESRRGITLERFGFHPLHEEAIVDGHIRDTAAVVDGLERLFHRSRRKRIAIRASGHGVIIKKITLPLMTPEELAEQIGWESEQHIPFDRTEVQIDHQILARNEGTGQMDVLLVAAKLEELNSLLNVTQDAGLRPLVVDLDAFCVQNVYTRAYGESPEDETHVLIHTGASLTTINIISRGITAFTRDIAMAGNMITEEIQRRMGVSFAEAEAMKCEPTPLPEVASAIDLAVDRLVSEVHRSLDFYIGTTGDDAISKIFLSGGTANLEPLVHELERRQGSAADRGGSAIEATVERIDPLLVAHPEPKKVDPASLVGRSLQMTVALGLALRKEKEKR